MKKDNTNNIYNLINLREDIRNKLEHHKDEITNNSQCNIHDFNFRVGNSDGYSTLECNFFFSMLRGYKGISFVNQYNPKIPKENFNRLVIAYLNADIDSFWDFVEESYTKKIKLSKEQLIKDIKEKEELLKNIEEGK